MTQFTAPLALYFGAAWAACATPAMFAATTRAEREGTALVVLFGVVIAALGYYGG